MAVLLGAGAAASWLQPACTRRAGLAVLAVALLATLASVFRIAVGLGPLTLPDLAYHLGMVVLLTWALSYTARALP